MFFLLIIITNIVIFFTHLLKEYQGAALGRMETASAGSGFLTIPHSAEPFCYLSCNVNTACRGMRERMSDTAAVADNKQAFIVCLKIGRAHV